MKIGILTLPQETNYGGILQAFALQRMLRKMGYDPITIDRHNRKEYPSFIIHVAGYCKRLFQHFFQRRKNVSTKWNPFITIDDYKLSTIETQKFIDRNICMTRCVFSDELAEIEKEYQFDAYVVGSDQVWLDYYCPSSFLDFVSRPNVKKVAYAASCGKKSFFNNTSKVIKCRELAKTFDGISVREEQLVCKCKEFLGIDAEWVLDPTMLLDPNEYLEVTISNVGNEPVLFSYILDTSADKDNLIDSISNSLRLQIVNGNRIEEIGNNCIAFPSVDDWVRNISRAGFVVTDSFHGTVFSILFNKPFISVVNKDRGADRFISLLKRFGLETRLITDLKEDQSSFILKESIDYSLVNKIIKEEREKSLSFLKTCLQKDV